MAHGKAHKQATPEQIADLRARLKDLEASNQNVKRYKWYTTDRVLHRFITARNGDVPVALKMLLDHLDWRVDYGVDTLADEDLSGVGLEKEFYWNGFDKGGRPCLVFRACAHRRTDSATDATPEQKVRYYCQLLERGFRDFAPAYKFCLILDCRGAGKDNFDRKLMKVATPIIENNYPESQHATYVVPCGALIMMVWKVISAFIDPGTAEKIRLLSSFGDSTLTESFTADTLKAFIDLDPSKASPQPYVAPDPLSVPPPASKPPSPSPMRSETVRAAHVGEEEKENMGDKGSVGSAGRSSWYPPPSPAYREDEENQPDAVRFNPIREEVDAEANGYVRNREASAVVKQERMMTAAGASNRDTRGVNGAHIRDTKNRDAADTASAIKLATATTDALFEEERTHQDSNASTKAPIVIRFPTSDGARTQQSVSSFSTCNGHSRGNGNSVAAGTVSITSPTRNAVQYATLDAHGEPTGENGHGVQPAAGLSTGPGSAEAGVGLGIGVGTSASRSRSGTMPVSSASATHSMMKQGFLYKRRNNLRGRFAFRKKYAVLQYTPATPARGGNGRPLSNAAALLAAASHPPTLLLSKGRTSTDSDKIIPLEGAEVTLGTSKAGVLFPFVISFYSATPPNLSSAVGNGNESRFDQSEDENAGDRYHAGNGAVSGSTPTSGSSARGGKVAARSSSVTRYNAQQTSKVLQHRGKRRTVHLACDTEEEVVKWTRWLAEATSTYEAAKEAASTTFVNPVLAGLGAPGGVTLARAALAMMSSSNGVMGSSAGAGAGEGEAGSTMDGASISYRSKYVEILDALAAVTDGNASSGRGAALMDSYRRGKAAGIVGNGDGILTSAPPVSVPSNSRRAKPSSSNPAATVAWHSPGETGTSLIALRDGEIARLRRSYARAELSRGEMRRCLRALAVQLREGEDRTGALLAEREALLLDTSSKMAEREAQLEQQEEKAHKDQHAREELLSSLQQENAALQIAMERLRLDCEDVRVDRESRAASSAMEMSGFRGLFSRHSVPNRRSSQPLAKQSSMSSQVTSHDRCPTNMPSAQQTAACRIHLPGYQRTASFGSELSCTTSRFAELPGHDMTRGAVVSAGEDGIGEDRMIRPWILNIDQVWEGSARPPFEVVQSLIRTLPEAKMVGSKGRLGHGRPVSGEELWPARGSMMLCKSYRDWSRRTGELQQIPRPEVVDPAGQTSFMELCLQLLRAHTAEVLGKDAKDLTEREESRMAYSIGGSVYTIKTLRGLIEATSPSMAGPTE